MGAGEEVDEVAGGARGMDVDRTGEIGDRANKGQVAGCMEQVSGKERKQRWAEGEREQG